MEFSRFILTYFFKFLNYYHLNLIRFDLGFLLEVFIFHKEFLDLILMLTTFILIFVYLNSFWLIKTIPTFFSSKTIVLSNPFLFIIHFLKVNSFGSIFRQAYFCLSYNWQVGCYNHYFFANIFLIHWLYP
jgi:hypothetical protein